MIRESIEAVVLILIALIAINLVFNEDSVKCFLIVPVLFLIPNELLNLIYFGRTITLSDYGCIIRFLNRTVIYTWDELYVIECSNQNRIWLLGEFDGKRAEGVLITPVNPAKNKKLGVMAWCRIYAPMQSVFIRYQESLTKRYMTSTRNYVGYVLPQSAIQPIIYEKGRK